MKNKPYLVKLEKDKSYAWCECAESKDQPFCDGSHKKEGRYKSLKYLANDNKEEYFCGCKKTQNPPFCDGSHSKL